MAHQVAVMIVASLVPRRSSGYVHEANESTCYKWPSYVRGYHRYKALGCYLSIGESVRLTTELTYQSAKPRICGCNKSQLCSGTCSKDSQWESLLLLGKVGSVGFCDVTGAMVNRDDGRLA